MTYILASMLGSSALSFAPPCRESVEEVGTGMLPKDQCNFEFILERPAPPHKIHRPIHHIPATPAGTLPDAFMLPRSQVLHCDSWGACDRMSRAPRAMPATAGVQGLVLVLMIILLFHK